LWALVDDPIFLKHRCHEPHRENPMRLIGLGAAVTEALGEPTRLPVRPATEAELRAGHTAEYIELVRRSSREHGWLDADTYLCPDSCEVASHAVGAAIDAARCVASGAADGAVCLIRPPGHHAEPSRGMGFCIFNNVGVAARVALEAGWVRRVAVVDFDVHHGNGTQAMLWEEPRALFVSIHQWGIYPLTGPAHEVGGPGAEGTHINVPLPRGAGDADYLAVIARVVVPMLSRFGPELVLVSAGYDAAAADPLGGARLTPRGFAAMAAALREVAPRPVLCLEGGYDPPALKACLTAQVRVWAGRDAGPRTLEGEPSHAAASVIAVVREIHGIET